MIQKRLLLIAGLISNLVAFAQQDEITLCHTPSTEKFALFASNKSFNREHPNPRVYTHVSEAGGRMITFPTPDGKEANGFVIEAQKKTSNWIFVFQEWWGLNDNVKRQSEDLFKEVGNVNVLALDMYDGKIATDAEMAGKYMQEFKQERGDAIVKGALEFVGTNAKIGTVGWCFGGGQSLLAALSAGKQARACVIYYGMPVEDVAQLKKLNCEVLGIFASKDRWINTDVVKKFEANMNAANEKLTIKNYDADHGFANPSNPIGNFNEAAAKNANHTTVSFFQARFK
jgi:carboxymethylenebutenolidase